MQNFFSYRFESWNIWDVIYLNKSWIFKLRSKHLISYISLIFSILFILSLYVFNFWNLRSSAFHISILWSAIFRMTWATVAFSTAAQSTFLSLTNIRGRQFKAKACIEVTCTPAGWVRVARLRFHFYDAHPVPGSHPLEHALPNSAGSDHVLTVNARAKGISVSIICTIRSVTRRRASDRRYIEWRSRVTMFIRCRNLGGCSFERRSSLSNPAHRIGNPTV